MAVVISKQGGGHSSGPKKIWRRIRDSDNMIKIVAGLTIVSLIAGGTFLYLGIRDYRAMANARAEWTQISDLASGTGSGDVQASEPVQFIEIPAGASEDEFLAISNQAVYKPDDILYKSIDLAALQSLNPNVTGYIYVPGSAIDYPILQEQSVGDYFYIDHNIYNKPDRYGSIFELSDQERGANSPVTWIFGHHMASGSMFSGLYDFLKPDFAATPVYIYRDGYRIECQAFAACVVDMDDLVYDFGGYDRGSEAYIELLDRMYGVSKLAFETDKPGPDDETIILSTCYGSAGTRDRLIVLLKEIRRAVTPEYYNTLLDVYQYGGSQTPLDSDEITGPNTYVDPNENLSNFETVLAGSGTDSRNAFSDSGSDMASGGTLGEG